MLSTNLQNSFFGTFFYSLIRATVFYNYSSRGPMFLKFSKKNTRFGKKNTKKLVIVK